VFRLQLLLLLSAALLAFRMSNRMSTDPFDLWFYILGTCVALHVLLGNAVLWAIGRDSDLAQELFAEGNAWLGPKPWYMPQSLLLRARYYLLWKALPEEVQDESLAVRAALFVVRLSGLMFPLAFVGFWVQAFIAAS
jgi:hypothetical protein